MIFRGYQDNSSLILVVADIVQFQFLIHQLFDPNFRSLFNKMLVHKSAMMCLPKQTQKPIV